jgi:hypothetical protein
LRDSLHAGVSYGRYDLPRILDTITLGLDESEDPVVSIEEGGWHAAEGLILARYMMFTQVYFHHTRLAFDYHVEQVLEGLLSRPIPGRLIPPSPTYPSLTEQDSLNRYIQMDDWWVLGLIHSGLAGQHGEFILKRSPHRGVYETPEVPEDRDLEKLDQIKVALGELVKFVGDASKSWYSRGANDLSIVPNRTDVPVRGRPLSTYSRIVANLGAVAQQRIYVDPNDRESARSIVRSKGGQPL